MPPVICAPRHDPLRRTLILALAAACVAPAVAAQPVTVFAAASLKSALDEVWAAWRAQAGAAVTTSYAGTSALARQIQHGAPADLFIAANMDWMDALERDGLIRPDSRRDLLGNRLALIAHGAGPSGDEIGPDFDLPGLLRGDRLAMALVDAVPAGIYGRAALRSLGLWDAVAGQVAQTDNVRSTLALVARGEAPYGVVYATDAAAAASQVRVIGLFPVDSHPPIVYPAALTRDAASAADALLDYLDGAEAQAVFARHGFLRPH